VRGGSDYDIIAGVFGSRVKSLSWPAAFRCTLWLCKPDCPKQVRESDSEYAQRDLDPEHYMEPALGCASRARLRTNIGSSDSESGYFELVRLLLLSERVTGRTSGVQVEALRLRDTSLANPHPRCARRLRLRYYMKAGDSRVCFAARG
jgi:hypothetical protein